MVGGDEPTAPQQMRETRLMRRGDEAPIRRPPIADQHAGEVVAEHRGGLVETAAGLNSIHRRVRRREGPQPLQLAPDLPAGFIRTDHRTAAHRGTQRRVGRLRVTRGAMHRLDETAARDRQAILLLKEGGDLAVRQAELFIENDGERDGLRPQLRSRGTERIRRLASMPTLDATPAPATPSDVDLKGTDHDTRHRQLFLELRRDTGLHDVIATAGTTRRQPRVMRLVDARRHAATSLRSIASAGLAPRTFRMFVQRFGKRRRLAIARPAGLVELSLEAVHLLTQSLVLSA